MVEYPPSHCPDCGSGLDASAAPRYDCPACGRHVYHSPVPAAGVAVIDTDADRVLLVERDEPPNAGDWALPAGHADLGEGPAATAVRELREETALAATTEDLTLVDAAATSPAGQADRSDKSVIRVTYAVARRETVGEPAPDDDVRAVEWVDRDALAEVDWAFEEGIDEVRTAFDLV